MAQTFEGSCNGRPVNPEIGADKSGRPRVRWDMQVVDGEHAGKVAKYSGKLDPENIKYTKRDMIAIGWQGKDVRTFVDDVKRANKVVPFTAEIAEFNGSTWTSARMTTGAPLAELDRGKVEDVNRWFAEADGGGNSGVPF